MKPPGSVDWTGRRIDAITQSDVASLFERIKAAGHPTTANRTIELVSAMYNFARRRKVFDGNPAEGIETAPERERTRFLRSEELPQFLRALEQIDQPWRDYFGVLLHIGYRRRAVAAMRWADVDLQAGVWHIPGTVTKHGEPVVMPIVGEAAVILNRRAAQRKKRGLLVSSYVFPGKSEAGHISQPKKQWAKLLQIAGITDLHIHDLRRTLGSWLAMGGASLPLIGRALGHLDSKSTAVYARMQTAPIAAAVKQAQQAMLQAGLVSKRRRS